MKFRKDLMLKRLEKEGRSGLIDHEIMCIMNDLDGRDVDPNCWKRQVMGEDVYYVVGSVYGGQYVNAADCE